MEVITIKDFPIQKNRRGEPARFLIDRKDVSVTNLMLEPGQEVPEHITPVDVFFHVIEGKGTVKIGEESEVVSEGDLIISPAKIPHALKASEGERFSFLVVKTPNPKYK